MGIYLDEWPDKPFYHGLLPCLDNKRCFYIADKHAHTPALPMRSLILRD